MQRIVYVASGAGAALLALSFLLFSSAGFFQTLVVLGLMATFFPPVFSSYMGYRRVKMIEEHFPDFLRDLSESKRSGMTLPKAIDAATRAHYGPLSQEVKLLAAQISWGLSFERALVKFSGRIRSKLVKQAVMIITEAQRSGGDIADILDTVATDIRTLKDIESERKSKLKVYLISIYFIFFLFLGILVVLAKTFIPATPQLSALSEIMGTQASKLSEDDYKTFFFHISLMQALLAGLVGGQMGEGSVISGFKHSLVMIIITLIVFQVFLGPEPLSVRLADVISKIPPSAQGMNSPKIVATVYEDTTSADIVFLLQQAARERYGAGFEKLTPGNIRFVQGDCQPCNEGRIRVSENAVIVNRPSRITYQVMNTGESRYTVLIGGG